MLMKLSSLFVALTIATAGAPLAGQSADGPKTLTGTVTVTSKKGGNAVAVHGRSTDQKQGDFLFCIDRRSAAGDAFDFTGPAKVTYLPRAASLPPGVVIRGPENVASTLTVAADDGQVWHFVAKGQKPLGPAAGAKTRTVTVDMVQRVDWQPENGPRRGTDIEGCLAPGG